MSEPLFTQDDKDFLDLICRLVEDHDNEYSNLASAYPDCTARMASIRNRIVSQIPRPKAVIMSDEPPTYTVGYSMLVGSDLDPGEDR